MNAVGPAGKGAFLGRRRRGYGRGLLPHRYPGKPGGYEASVGTTTPTERAHKTGGDLLDLFCLIPPGVARSIARALSDAPHDLGSWCRQEIKRCMLDEADRTVGITVRSGVGKSNTPSVD
jgi:hypothetical protein